MARKNLLKGLMDEATKAPAPPDETETRVDPARPRYKGGAIGAVSQSIADLKSRSVIEIDPHMINAGGLPDRLDDNEADHQALVTSIRESGQQVPILVRPHPEKEGRYQIVYGRRRVLALRDIGQPVKALVRDLDDHEVVLAQGQENAARKDLSFIEKVNFARQMRELGYDRKAICSALHIDKTLISRMLSVADRIPFDIIEVVGAAPSVGRDRWLALADAFDASSLSVDESIALVNLSGDTDNSDKRFETLSDVLNRRASPPVAKKAAAPIKADQPLLDASGARLGKVTRKEKTTVLTLNVEGSGGFDLWLADNIAEIHRRWKTTGGE